MEKDKTTSTEQLKELLKAILSGEWKVEKYDPQEYLVIGKDEEGEDYQIGNLSFKPHADLLSLAPTLAAEVIELREQLENRNEFEKQETEALRLLNYVRSENKVLREALIMTAFKFADVRNLDIDDNKIIPRLTITLKPSEAKMIREAILNNPKQ